MIYSSLLKLTPCSRPTYRGPGGHVVPGRPARLVGERAPEVVGSCAGQRRPATLGPKLLIFVRPETSNQLRVGGVPALLLTMGNNPPATSDMCSTPDGRLDSVSPTRSIIITA